MEKKITDLHCYCLEEIFKYLNEDELLNVAASDEHFISSCSNIFFKKYKTKTLIFNIYGGARKIERQINVLRYFSKSISTLDVDCRLKDFKRILDTFTKHCKESAREIIFRDGDILSKPFLNPEFEKLTFSDCVINFSKKMSVNFPNLHLLTFNGEDSKSSTVPATFIEQTFLNLKAFCAKNVNLNLKSLMIFTSLNPQLESLTLIADNMTNTFIGDIAETLPNLKSLTIDLMRIVHVQVPSSGSSGYNKKETLLRELKSLKLFLDRYDQFACLVSRLPISSNLLVEQIEQLELHLNDSHVKNEFYDFIARCKNLKYLKVFDCDLFHLNKLTNMQQLRHIEIKSSGTGMREIGMMINVASGGIDNILNTSPHLHQIYLKHSFPVNFFHWPYSEENTEEIVSDMRSRIGANWVIVGKMNYDKEQLLNQHHPKALFYMNITKK